MAWGEDYSGGDGIASVLADTTPQLGGDLDVNGHSIVSAAAGDIALTPDTTGDLIFDGVKWPQADGANRAVLQTNGAGQSSWQGSSGTGNIVRVLTPTIITPSIASFLNANHPHTAGAGGGTIAHTALTDKGTTSHADIDTHVANNPLNNLGAAVNPDADDDVDGGYAVGSVWLNTTQGRAFVCLDASDGAAVWVELGHTHTVPIRIDNPTAADTMFITHNEGPIIVLAAAGQVTTGTSLTWQVTWEDHDAFAPGTDIFTADMVSTTTWGSKTTADFVSSGAVAANKKLYFEAQSRSGTPARFEGWVKFVEVGIS